MCTWRAVAHGLVGGGMAGILIWAVFFFVSMGAGVPEGATILLASGLALLAGLALNLAGDMMYFRG